MTPALRILERVSRVAPVGLRFVDDSTGAVVSEGLDVELYPVERPLTRVAARPNRSGTFYATRLPGVPATDLFGEGDDEYWRQVTPRAFAIEVTDRRGQFQPFRAELGLPARGHAAPLCLQLSSPPSTVIPLFGTSSRLIPAGMTAIRADLRYPVSVDGRTVLLPAAWAVIEARVGGMAPCRGVADRDGRVVVLLPYPEPAQRPARPASPPFPGGQALVDQEWSVAVSAWFEPEAPVPAIPELCRTLAQQPATLWADAGQLHVMGEQALRYGRELVVRTAGADGSVAIVTPR